MTTNSVGYALRQSEGLSYESMESFQIAYQTNLQQAVANNAEWCRVIARCHGRSSHQTQHAWCCEEEMPPLYPNLVMLDSSPEIPVEVSLLESALCSGWGLKDSFACLDLASHGYTNLQTSLWYGRDPAKWSYSRRITETVRIVETQQDLIAWVDAWGETPSGCDIFTSKLLEEESVKLLYIERGGTLVAGLATNLSDQVVGISNTFGCPQDLLACIGHCAETHIDRSIVGYGDRNDLHNLSHFDFKSLGYLRVWLKD